MATPQVDWIRKAALAVAAIGLSACAEQPLGDVNEPGAASLRTSAQAVCGGADGLDCGQGLIAAYYNRENWTQLRDVQVDANIDYNWGGGQPHPQVGNETFTVRWGGFLTAPQTAEYRFWVWSDDGLEVFLDGNVVADDLGPGGHGGRWVAGDPVDLVAGTSYGIMAQMREDYGGAAARLAWQIDGGPRTIIPSNVFGTRGDGSGMRAEWFASPNDMLNNEPPAAVTVVSDFDFDFEAIRPPEVSDGFAVRLTGELFGLHPQDYSVRLGCNGGARLMVVGDEVSEIDEFGRAGVFSETVATSLTPGLPAIVVLEYADTIGGSPACTLEWSNPELGTGDYYVIPSHLMDPTVVGRGSGLEAKYYDNVDQTNLVSTQVDPQINFDWANQAPTVESGYAMGSNYYSMQWEGLLQAPTTETYTFHGTADDYIELWMATSWVVGEGTDVCSVDADCGWDRRCDAGLCADPIYTRHISRWNGTSSADVDLEQGEYYPIQVRYREYTSSASVSLEWETDTIRRQVIPVFQFFAPERDINVGEGLEGHYFPYRLRTRPFNTFDPRSSTAPIQRTDAEINFNWGNASPAPEVSFPSNNFMVYWDGQIEPRYSQEYTFRTFTDDGVVLYINGERIIDYWNGYAGERTGTVRLEAGKRYDIFLAMWDGGGSAQSRLLWSSASQLEEVVPSSQLFPPVPLGLGEGLLGEYFGDLEMTPEDVRLVRVDRLVDQEYDGVPSALLPDTGHSIRWRGQILPFFSELYTLTVRSTGGARIYVDGQLIAENWSDAGDGLVDVSGSAILSAEQTHEITVEYRQEGTVGDVELLWASESQVEAVVPSSQLFPADPEDRVAFGQCRSVISIEDFDDGSLPDSLEEQEGLQLTNSFEAQPDLWVANSSDRTLTRIDTASGQVLGTYPAGKDASRTAVDLDFNVWVANRAFNEEGTLTKVLSVNADGSECQCCSSVDANGECIYDPLDICSECVAYTIDLGFNVVPRGLAVDGNNNVWVGLHSTAELIQIRNCPVDPDTGVIDYDCANPLCLPDDPFCVERAEAQGRDCSTVPSETCRGDQQMQRVSISDRPYGLAIDQTGKIWIASIGNRIACYDTLSGESCGRYDLRDASNARQCTSPYGIAVDGEGNVWWGNWSCGGLGYLSREVWERSVATNSGTDGQVAWDAVIRDVSQNGIHIFTHPNDDRTRGVAVDGRGMVWVASSGTNRMLQFDPTADPDPGDCNPSGSFCPSGNWVGTYETCSGPIGVGISEQGHAWGVCRSNDEAQAFDNDGTVLMAAPTGDGPYSYSDMTGFQLRNFTAPQGQWSRVFDCAEDAIETDENGQCVFDYLTWDALTPTGTRVMVRVRAGNDDDGDGTIEWEPWSAEYEVTPAPLGREGFEGDYVEVEVTLFSSQSGETPVVDTVQLWQCPQLFPPIGLDVDERFIVDASANDYGLSWTFVDGSWPESYWELFDDEGVVQCQVLSTTSLEKGDRYSGTGNDTPACREEGHLPNTPLTRSAQTVNVFEGEEYRSALGPPVTRYTLVNDPTEANRDLRVMARTNSSITVNWCKPQRNWAAALTGAQVVRSTTPNFDPGDEDYEVIASFPQTEDATMGERGYADPDAFCGNFTDNDLQPGTVYYYELRYQNGDGIESAPMSVSLETYGRPCCGEIGTCEGVCGGAATTGDGSPTDIYCGLPPEYEDPELTCDSLDNDCDGLVDEGLTNSCGGCGPEPVEVCDGVDNDCDGSIDNNAIDGFFYYPDVDRDTWGDDTGALFACERPDGWIDRGGDCVDNDPAINPDAEELCDGIDNNCNGEIDENGEALSFYADTDDDGFGDPDALQLACAPPPGYVDDDTDCDDTEPTTYPGAPELCDGADNNCNGATDEGFALYDVTIDEVSDVATVGVDACENAYTGPECESAAAVIVRVSNTGTADIPANSQLRFRLQEPYVDTLYEWDALPRAVIPGGEETFTYCFAHSVESLPTTYTEIYADLDVDGAAGCGTAEAVIDGDGLLISAAELCDGIDNDCNGEVDESPAACGVTRICVENETGVGDPYLCVQSMVAESASCTQGECPAGTYCDDSGACVRACGDDLDCGANAECHQGACVAVEAIDAEAEATATTEEGASTDAPATSGGGQAGCAAASSTGSAGWAGLLLGLCFWHRRRRTARQ